MSQITISHLSFTYDGDYTPVFQDLDLRLDTGWKLGLVGRNGRGKTTLLKLLAGEAEGRGTISRPVPCLRWPRPVSDPMRPVRALLLEETPPEEAWRLDWELSKVGLEGEVLDRPFAALSGGEQTRALLAALFLREDAYPMIDEPTNHLDAQGRALVADYLRGLDRGFLLVSHDRAFLDRCTDHTLALNRTGPELIRGSFSVWWGEKEARDRGELARNEKLKGEIRRLEQAARRTAAWSDKVERSKYGGENSGLKVDRGFVGHRSAKLMKRAKGLESRQEEAIREKSALLRDVERADELKLFPLTYPGAACWRGGSWPWPMAAEALAGQSPLPWSRGSGCAWRGATGRARPACCAWPWGRSSPTPGPCAGPRASSSPTYPRSRTTCPALCQTGRRGRGWTGPSCSPSCASWTSAGSSLNGIWPSTAPASRKRSCWRPACAGGPTCTCGTSP